MSNAASFRRSQPGCEDLRCNTPHEVVHYCVDCSARLCETCWDLVLHHRPEKLGSDRKLHEKTDENDYYVARRLKTILDPTVDQRKLQQLHEEDEKTTWFGITRDPTGRPFFADYGTYARIMTASTRSESAVRFPQLVSFVGQTNAGKSTLIKMLIEYQETRADPQADPTYPSPVVGASLHDTVPTSADVHLYADPATAGGSLPMLYADCEGLNAGETEPMGIAWRKSRASAKDLVNRITNSRLRQLEWATTDQRRTRSFAVTKLYPRLLYTFSDVVVFVTKNAKTFQESLQLLLDWGSASLEKSVNQPALPHAIIVVNATEQSVDPKEWDIGHATETLLKAVSQALDPFIGAPEFLRRAYFWRSQGIRIESMKDLIRCYYSSFRVVRIPNRDRLGHLREQIHKLHETIADRCDAAYYDKKSARMLSNSSQLNIYIQSAFDHFSCKLEKPFDFIEVSLKHNPIPLDFGGHILQLAVAVQNQWVDQTGAWIFDRLSSMVASCVLLDCRGRPGLAQELAKHHQRYFYNALEEFCDMSWPCGFSNEKGRCVNVKSRHISKGHQNDKGKIIAAGDYRSSFSALKYGQQWNDTLFENIQNLQNEILALSDKGTPDEKAYIDLHTRNMTSFYKGLGSARRFISHCTCFCCLMEIPEHPLPCGHILCAKCVRSFGQAHNKSNFELNSCPLHPDDSRWAKPCVVRFKPEYAGSRILSLDGGGIRGIVELEVLRAIQEELGNKIPIREFFDLIVGTSTGGIIALALGVKAWPVEKCIEQFTKLCDQAFTPREFHNIPGFDHAARLNHGSKYKTTPLHNALEKSLGKDLLFGGAHDLDKRNEIKVAVTSTDEIGMKAIVIANYSRIWEAAAATSAASPFFKPFRHKATGQIYFDGAFYNNNPAVVAHRERKLLWRDVAQHHPDIFLSVGTGQNMKQIAPEIERHKRSMPSNNQTEQNVSSRQPDTKNRKVFSKWRQILTVVHHRFDNILNAELAWNDFVKVVVDSEHSNNRRRYIRINPNLNHDPPPLDEKKQIYKLQEDAITSLSFTNEKIQIQKIAYRLIASSFYYDRTSATRDEPSNRYSCAGRICCRFEEDSPYLRALGEFFQMQQKRDFRPYFEINEHDRSFQMKRIELSETVISRMIKLATFDLGPLDIHVSSKNARVTISLYFRTTYEARDSYKSFPISGFPRALMLEEEQKRMLSTKKQSRR
ncbi:hypothetical protein AOQ84DRAFT_293846 [Glonium stellatum]|uniref:FabD/lysophospholipase-like protein n=1 Tax=Glonium stellatum TaxID=574774 RepID=A0A8E2F0V7_9PEZI|nr:hypothetical protein AOQ84DRAFT_293846 [Glonium stellatum]